MPRGWQSLLKVCLREAERGETAKRAAYKAMLADVRRDISPEFLKRLRRMAESNQPTLPGFGSADMNFAAGAAATPHERCIALQAQRLHANGFGGRDLMQLALAAGLSDMRAQQLRQVEQHVYLDARGGAREVMAAVRTACTGVAERLAAECCGSVSKRAAAAIRTRIDPDEDLAIHP
jgi:hypothetical protein